jgi:hypothetical protein
MLALVEMVGPVNLHVGHPMPSRTVYSLLVLQVTSEPSNYSSW